VFRSTVKRRITLVLGRPSAFGHDTTHSADRRGHSLDHSSHSPIPPRATKKTSCSVQPAAAVAIPTHAVCPRALTPPSLARAPILRNTMPPPYPLHLRVAITPSPPGHLLRLRAPHSISAWPSTLSLAGYPLVPYAPLRLRMPIRRGHPLPLAQSAVTPSWPRPKPPPPLRRHQDKVIAS
jgi:hypothetical protein